MNSSQLGLHENKTIQYFCNHCLALINSWKFLSCLDLVNQYEKYSCLVLKFLIILELRKCATVGESIFRKGLKSKYPGKIRSTQKWSYADVRQKTT